MGRSLRSRRLAATDMPHTFGNGRNNSVTLGGGIDTVTGGNGNNLVVAGNGNDNATLGNGSNVISLGDDYEDRISVGDGNNSIAFGAGAVVFLGDGNNTVRQEARSTPTAEYGSPEPPTATTSSSSTRRVPAHGLLSTSARATTRSFSRTSKGTPQPRPVATPPGSASRPAGTFTTTA